MKKLTEEWIDLEGSRETYQISNLGNVRRASRVGARGRIIKSHEMAQSLNSNGYIRVSLATKDGSGYKFVHRLVAELFIPNPDNKPFVNHIDGNKCNNRADNLEWCTKSENERHAWNMGLHRISDNRPRGERHGMRKLSQNDVDDIRKSHIRRDQERGSSGLAKKYGVTPQTITDIVNGRSWKD